ncbi:hypothetical protein BCR39DRAFT_474459 [Naematelia encephala]|uniref:Uncharacterized protein n=1 Tax=Naematelia encephala TaxID=71784 RepID=A0A1Y2AHM0_9TREE|nr:hypothetical protein BCR39DRAFT_474459 [Naematelia encephala]
MYQRYAPALHSLSERTGTPLPSLFVSFLILHELTAFIPLLITFYIFNALGAGVAFVAWLIDITEEKDKEKHKDKDIGEQGQGQGQGWTMAGKVREWYDEAEKRVEKVGHRYGILGYEKTSKDDQGMLGTEQVKDEVGSKGTKAVGSVADAIAAYVVIKALLPVRIGASLWLAPGFARFALNPLQHLVRRLRR